MADLLEITLDRMPSWLLDTWGRAWTVVFGSVKQAYVEAVKAATKARFAAVAPSDALPQLGANVGFARSRNESIGTFRARLLRAFEIWQYCGTRKGLLDALDALYPEYPASATIEEYFDDPASFGVDPTRWARFRLEISIPHWGAAPLWDAFHWDDGSHWDVTAPEAEIRAVRGTIHRWTPAYARCVRLRVHVTGGTYVDIPDP